MKMAKDPVLKAKAKDAEPTLNLKERIGVARLARPDACLAVKGEGFKGQARGAAFKGRMRYMDVDRWKYVPSDHPYERDVCDLCVTECPIQDAIKLEAFTGPRWPQAPPSRRARTVRRLRRLRNDLPGRADRDRCRHPHLKEWKET